jgi:uncharacterized membrane-anchored protein YhcB (DUF1043 family)
MEPNVWFIIASMFVVGVTMGFIIGYTRNNDAGKMQELESELEKAQKEMGQYRGQVTDHFDKTAELFNRLTHDYRDVYEHLAVSSQILCGDQIAKITGEVPEKDLLEVELLDAQSSVEQTPEEQKEVESEHLVETPILEEAVLATKEEKSEEVISVTTEEKSDVEQTGVENEVASIEKKASEARIIH